MVQTFGERAVGISFNPSGNIDVDRIKLDFANLIDALHDKRLLDHNNDRVRMYSVAITELQTAQMWAVKALTWSDENG